MSRRAALFTVADVARALKAGKQAGVSVAVEITRDGTLRISPHESQGLQPPKPPAEQKRKFVL